MNTLPDTDSILLKMLPHQVRRDSSTCFLAFLFDQLYCIARKLSFFTLMTQTSSNLTSAHHTQLDNIWSVRVLGCVDTRGILHQLFQESISVLMQCGSGYKADRTLTRLERSSPGRWFRWNEIFVHHSWNDVRS